MRTSAIVMWILTAITFLLGLILILYGFYSLISIEDFEATNIFEAIFGSIALIGAGVGILAYFIIIGGGLILISIIFLIIAIILTAIGDNRDTPYLYMENIMVREENMDTAFKECVKRYKEDKCTQAKADYEYKHRKK